MSIKNLLLCAVMSCALGFTVTPASARTHHRHHTVHQVHHHYRHHHRYHVHHKTFRQKQIDFQQRIQDFPHRGFFETRSSLVAEARRWLGTNPTHRASLWCARFMNFVLNRTGHQGTGSDMAASFAHYGHRVPGPRVGAIAVMHRRGGGHVGVVSGFDPQGNPIVISGNSGHRVREGVYDRRRIYAYVMP